MQFTTNIPDSGKPGGDPADAVLLDVRGAGDYARGHLPGAINLPQDKWSTREGLNYAKPHVLYGHSQDCQLVAAAALEFARDGYSVAEMDGGFEAWKQAGFEIETDLHPGDQPLAPGDSASAVGWPIRGGEIGWLRGQLKSFETAVLLTQGKNSIGHGRPMPIARVDAHCSLWFITARDSAEFKEIEGNPAGQVICQNGGGRCLIVTGQAALVRDRGTVGEFWKPAFKRWFPGGPGDTSLVLIHFKTEHAEFWDYSGSAVSASASSHSRRRCKARPRSSRKASAVAG